VSCKPQSDPRWLWLTEGKVMRFVHMGMVCAGAGLLLLPLGGIPFTNTLPALVIVIGMLGVMERDGAAVAVAYGFLVATVIYFGLYAAVVIEIISRIRQHLGV
jgi:hypothetical protein